MLGDFLITRKKQRFFVSGEGSNAIVVSRGKQVFVSIYQMVVIGVVAFPGTVSG